MTDNDLVASVRRVLADADGFDLEALEPHDYRRQAAGVLRVVAEECDRAGGAYASRGDNDRAGAAFALMETFSRASGLAEYVATPCDVVVPCDPDGGEPCSTHERLMGHAEDNHELCDHAAEGVR